MVFVLDKHQQPLMPCSEKRGRLLLERGRAHVAPVARFTIRLVDRLREHPVLHDLRVKLDPGSKTTGVAVTLERACGTHVICLGEIVHKSGIKARLDARRAAGCIPKTLLIREGGRRLPPRPEARSLRRRILMKWYRARASRHRVLVAEAFGHLVARASLNPYSFRCASAGIADLSAYVDRRERGRGIGKHLLGAVEAAARAGAFRKIALMTVPFNPAAQVLYRRLGYREVGVFQE